MDAKFRGKSLQTGEWIYGSLIVYGPAHVTPDIYEPETSQFLAVDRETVGQFTGVKDKRGNEIYGGMKVSWKVGSLRVEGVVEYQPDAGLWTKGRSQVIASYQKSTEIIE